MEDHEIVDRMSNDLETAFEIPSHTRLMLMNIERSSSCCKKIYTSFAKKESFGVLNCSTKQNFCIFVCHNKGRHLYLRVTMKNNALFA